MLALVLLAGTLFLAVTMVLAWLVYTVATLRSEVAYISELNKVIDHVNALAHGVQQAHYRSTTRIDRADALAAAANEKGVEMDGRVDSLLSRINAQASKTRRNKDALDEVEATVGGVSTNTSTNTSAIGEHGVRLVELESSLTGLVANDDLEERLNNYVRSDELPDQDLGGYAKWSDFDEANLTTNSLRSGAIELTGPDSSETGTLTYSGDGITVVTGQGSPATKIGSSSLEFGANALRIDAEGDLAYCKGGAGCQKIQTT
eukprot:jgi/Tetstr1/464115/TSEL_008920.t1